MTKLDEQADATRRAASRHLDPLKRHQHRYWNGFTWTGDVGESGIQSSEPLAGEDSKPSVGAPTGTMVAGTAAPTVAPPANNGTAPLGPGSARDGGNPPASFSPELQERPQSPTASKKVKRAWNQKRVGPLVVFAVGAIVVGGVAGIGALGGGGSTSSHSGGLNNSVALATAIQASGGTAPGVDKPMANVVCSDEGGRIFTCRGDTPNNTVRTIKVIVSDDGLSWNVS